MSTKIYDGFRMKNISSKELVDFIKEIKIRLKPYINEEYVVVFSDVSEQMAKNLIYADYNYHKNPSEENYQNILEFLKTTYEETLSENALFSYLRKGEENEEIVSHFAWLMGNVFNTTIKTVKAYSDNHNQLYGINASMSFHSLNKKWLLFIPFGNGICNLFYNLLESKNPEDIEFVQKYGIETYGYWNNTDRPDDVTARQWTKRRKDWDIVFPPTSIGIPSEHGIVINNLIDDLRFHGIIDLNQNVDGRRTSILDRFSEPDVFLEEIARRMTIDKFTEEDEELKKEEKLSYSEIREVREKYIELFKDSSSKVYKAYENTLKEMKDTYDFKTKEDILKKPILRLIPNFTKDYDAKNPEIKIFDKLKE